MDMKATDLMRQLLPLLLRLAQMQGEPVDRLALQGELDKLADAQLPAVDTLDALMAALRLRKPRWIPSRAVDPAVVPCLIHRSGEGWRLLRGKNAQGQWVTLWFDFDSHQWIEAQLDELSSWQVAKLKLAQPFEFASSAVFNLIKRELFSNRASWLGGAVAGLMINLIALGTSFYSMQVYDRVVPTAASQTLWVLTIGVLIAIVFEMVTKWIRSLIYEDLVERLDQKLARDVYARFLAVRLDQLPSSVGSLASQLKGYETVRGFLMALSSHVMVDFPFAFVFMVTVGMVGGWLGVIPVVFFAVSLLSGLVYRRKVDALSHKATAASNFKTGLLVESIEGAETIKSGQSGWRMLSKWMDTTDEARTLEVQIKRISDNAQNLSAGMQQIAYVLMVAVGALQISRGELSMGGMIACSILSGRILGPVASLPSLLIQWSHTKSSLQGLDRLWALEDDHHGQEQAVVLQKIQGRYQLDKVVSSYAGATALSIEQLSIAPGDRVGVLGPIGAGKTTLLRLLSGMYKPQSGTVKLDGIDLAHISKPVLAERIGYLQQDGRLFAGTLRENLVLGMMDPGDDVILEAARKTGLHLVLAAHPKGLHQMIHEGGTGLSSGQRQLVNLTRVFLRQPSIWLLDEPTSSVDSQLEQQIIATLANVLKPTDILVVVTHKPDVLKLVNRIVVVANRQIVVDGPRDAVLKQLSAPRPDTSAPSNGVGRSNQESQA
jgi:ATP-binding cassette subfamily C protein LapB